MKCIVYIFFLLFFVGCTSLPNAKEGVLIERTEKNKTHDRYKQNGQSIDIGSLIHTLEINEQTRQLALESRMYYTPSRILNYFFIYSSLYIFTLPDDNTRKNLMAVGLGIFFSSLYLDHLALKRIDQAVDIYNQNLPTTKKETPTFRIAPVLQNENLGLVMEYGF